MSAQPNTEHARLTDAIGYRKFNDTYVEMFIEDFAKADDAITFLEDRGIGENHRKTTIGADVLHVLAKVWVKSQEKVYSVVGPIFWREMKELASEAFYAE